MDSPKDKVLAILERAPLPKQMKAYYKARVEKEGITPVLMESIKSAMRALENDAFGRTGITVDEDDDIEIQKAVSQYSKAVSQATEAYLKAANEAADQVVKITKKATKVIEKAEVAALKQAA